MDVPSPSSPVGVTTKGIPAYIKLTLAICLLIASLAGQFYGMRIQNSYEDFLAENVVVTATVVSPMGSVDNVGTEEIEDTANIVTVEYLADGRTYSYNAQKSLLNPSLQEGNTFDVVYPEYAPAEAQQVDRLVEGGLSWRWLSGFVSMFSIASIVSIVFQTKKAKKAMDTNKAK